MKMEEREREMRRLILYAVNGFAQNSFYNSLTSFLNRRGVAVKDIIEFLSEYGADISIVGPMIKDLIADGCLKQTDQNAVMSSYPPLSVPKMISSRGYQRAELMILKAIDLEHAEGVTQKARRRAKTKFPELLCDIHRSNMPDRYPLFFYLLPLSGLPRLYNGESPPR